MLFRLLFGRVLLGCAILFSANLFSASPFVMGRLTMGQFGNQLFIIAAATSVALDHDAIPLFPDLASQTKLDIKFNYDHVFYHLNASKPIRRVKTTYYEPSFTYQPIPYSPNMEIVGYFQSEKYFLRHKEKIVDLFAPHPEIVDYLSEKYGEIISHPQTVSIHLRNYLKEDPEQKVYPSYGVEYVKKAMELFPKDSLFVVFSNTIDRYKKEFAELPGNFRFIEGEMHHIDFYLMSLCKHNIICNSTFSWWAAYLNKNPGKIVVVPPVWFSPGYNTDSRDLIPPSWLILRD